MQELQVLWGNKGVCAEILFCACSCQAGCALAWGSARRRVALICESSDARAVFALLFLFLFLTFSYTLLLFNFHNFNSRFFMFCFFQLITHRLSGQEWTWCFHVLSCLSFPPCDPSHNIVWVDQSERENEHLRWLQCNDSLISVQNLSGGFKEVTLPCTFC